MFSSVVGRILEADECPLEVQSGWKTGDQGTFTLTQAEFEVKKCYQQQSLDKVNDNFKVKCP